MLEPDRDLCGHDMRAERRLQRIQRAKEVGALAVEHVDEDQPRDVQLLGAPPEALRRNLHPHHRIDDEDRRLAYAQGTERIGDERGIAGRVEEVDAAFVPLEGVQGDADRHPPRLLVRIVVRDRRAVGDRAQPRRRPGLEEQRLEQGGLAARPVSDEGHVANPIRRLVHAGSPLAKGLADTSAEPRRCGSDALCVRCPACRRPRSRSTALVCSWLTRDSVTPSTSPISRRVRFS